MVVAAGDLKNVLSNTEGRPLVVVPATRSDIILGIGAAQVNPSRRSTQAQLQAEITRFHQHS